MDNPPKPLLKQRAYSYAVSIMKIANILNKKNYSVQVITRQLIRSATSIGANIMEAQSGSSKKDFTNYFNHSLKSAIESKYWLMLLRDINESNREIISEVLGETDEITNILAASILTLKGKRKTNANLK